jgi:2-polyprenyl-3-methyl-5-hydroxy-6-metoxy-1,4-benzoquinol methylase
MQDEYGEQYTNLYQQHWWWRARERILTRVLEGLALPAHARVLDMGCGNGLFFPVLKRFGEVSGIETDAALISADNPDRARIRSQPLGAAYAGEKFDLITALDVLEHIEDDRSAFAQLLGMLKPSGYFVITVPALMSLWDHHDERNQHFRRYTRAELRALVGDSARVLELRYLFQATFFPKYAVARMNRFMPRGVEQTALPPAPLNRALTSIFDWEERVLRRMDPPFGTSLLAVLQKPT